MSKKERESGRQTKVKVGNISDIRGNVIVAGGNITTHHTVNGLSAAEIKQLFDGLYTKIEAHPNTPTAQKNEKVDEGFLSRRFRNIARMAADVLDLVVAMLAIPQGRYAVRWRGWE